MNIKDDLPRISKGVIENQYSLFFQNGSIAELIESLPYQLFILNSEKQIVFGNNVLANHKILAEIDKLLSLRPGEAIKCEYTLSDNSSCGTNEQCKFCAINNTFFKSKKTKKKEISTGQLYFEHNGEQNLFEYEVSISPLYFNNTEYYIVSIYDISKEKENEVFQKLFFHDILNLTGSLQGVFQLLKENPQNANNENLLSLAYTVSVQLSDEIQRQKEIITAEKGELSVINNKVNSISILKEVFEIMQNHKVAKKKNLEIDISSVNYDFDTDRVLLIRVLTNMVKNSFEAEKEDAVITIGASFNDMQIEFWVHNPSVIPFDIQHDIFHKSFSTKGIGRGLGTYSIKLFGQKLLQGNVGFVSNETVGTKFFIKFKIDHF